MSADQTLETEETARLEGDDEPDLPAVALEHERLAQTAALEDDEQLSQTAALEDDEQLSQTAALDDEQLSQTAALDDERPSGRSDAKDPWHGLNDFDEE